MNEKVIVSGNNVDLTESLRAYVSEKSDRLLRHEPSIVKIRVELKLNPNRSHSDEFEVRGTIEGLGKGVPFVASAATDDLYRAIDEMVDKLDRQLKTHASQELEKRRG